MKFTSIILCFCLFIASAQIAFAQKNPTFKVNSLVSNGKKSKETATKLVFSETSFSASLKKKGNSGKEFNYADIVGAEYSHSEKPFLSSGGAIAATLLLGLWAVPLLFIKKKHHWLAVRTENDFVVLHLSGGNYRQILNEFEKRKVAVGTVDEKLNIKKY